MGRLAKEVATEGENNIVSRGLCDMQFKIALVVRIFRRRRVKGGVRGKLKRKWDYETIYRLLGIRKFRWVCGDEIRHSRHKNSNFSVFKQ